MGAACSFQRGQESSDTDWSAFDSVLCIRWLFVSFFSFVTERGCSSTPRWVTTRYNDQIVTELVMEKLDGPNLLRFIKMIDDHRSKPVLSPDVLTLLMTTLFEKVADVHSHGFLHRDINLVQFFPSHDVFVIVIIFGLLFVCRVILFFDVLLRRLTKRITTVFQKNLKPTMLS
jgi:serine/threonine protein kinase